MVCGELHKWRPAIVRGTNEIVRVQLYAIGKINVTYKSTDGKIYHWFQLCFDLEYIAMTKDIIIELAKE